MSDFLFIRAGIPTIDEYHGLLKDDLFLSIERFSEAFLEINKSALVDYSKKWVADPLHQWGRQWEYPFVFENILAYNEQHKDGLVKILDAGSGSTFFPYLIASRVPGVEITCCDYDTSLPTIFSQINTNTENKVQFDLADIHKLPYKDKTFDIVYCISVLEHTKHFEQIIKEFKRVLKQNGMLIVTFDVALDGFSDIPPKAAEKLIRTLQDYFPRSKVIEDQKVQATLNSKDVLTTNYIKTYDTGLLPWKYPILSNVKSMLHAISKFRAPKSVTKNLTCYCQVFTNDI